MPHERMIDNNIPEAWAIKGASQFWIVDHIVVLWPLMGVASVLMGEHCSHYASSILTIDILMPSNTLRTQLRIRGVSMRGDHWSKIKA